MFNIITDSTAYLTREEAKALNVKVIPMTFTVGDKRYAEGYSGEQKYHISEIEKYFEVCKTSQPNLKVLSDAFKHSAQQGRKTLYISMSSRLSGAYNSACLAANEAAPDNVKVFDSLSVAAGEKMLTELAVQLRNEGKTIEEVLTKLEEERAKIKVLFSVSDMDALRRSGRIGFVKQSISNILNIVPLLRLNAGAIESITNARGVYNFLKRVKEYIPSDIKSAVLMAFEEEKLTSMEEYLTKHYPGITKISKQRPGAVLAIHLGYKSFGIAWKE